MATTTQHDLVNAVIHHALIPANYSAGWSWIAECHTYYDIVDLIGLAQTERGAIYKVGQVVKARAALEFEIVNA